MQARVALPACIVCVDAANVVAPDGKAAEVVADAVAGGATAVLLADTGGTGAPRMLCATAAAPCSLSHPSNHAGPAVVRHC
jgi:hypothetical protein